MRALTKATLGIAEGEVADSGLPPVNPNYEANFDWARLPAGITRDASTSSIAAPPAFTGPGTNFILKRGENKDEI